jgi:competence protein ComEC
VKSIRTRFRAYHLGCSGSSFSYFAVGHFTMIEGRLTEDSRHQVETEMEICGVDAADNLHITSRDSDHCNKYELSELLNLIRPRQIECPGYDPVKDYGHGEECLEMIAEYRSRPRNTGFIPVVKHITLGFIHPRAEAGVRHGVQQHVLQSVPHRGKRQRQLHREALPRGML